MAALLIVVFPAAMLAAAATDVASMTIPNRLVVALAAAFALFALAAGWPLSLLGLHAATAVVMLLLTFGCFAAGWMGGGDAKLIAAVALWLGPGPELFSFLIWTALLGGLLTLALVLARRCISPSTGYAALDRLLSPRTGVPYGVAIGASGLLVFPSLLEALPG